MLVFLVSFFPPFDVLTCSRCQKKKEKAGFMSTQQKKKDLTYLFFLLHFHFRFVFFFFALFLLLLFDYERNQKTHSWILFFFFCLFSRFFFFLSMSSMRLHMFYMNASV